MLDGVVRADGDVATASAVSRESVPLTNQQPPNSAAVSLLLQPQTAPRADNGWRVVISSATVATANYNASFLSKAGAQEPSGIPGVRFCTKSGHSVACSKSKFVHQAG